MKGMGGMRERIDRLGGDETPQARSARRYGIVRLVRPGEAVPADFLGIAVECDETPDPAGPVH